jgi:hypothetical protein
MFLHNLLNVLVQIANKMGLQKKKYLNGNNLNIVRREASRHFRNKIRDYLKDKINELPTSTKNKNIRDLYRGKINLRGAAN